MKISELIFLGFIYTTEFLSDKNPAFFSIGNGDFNAEISIFL